jgi:hypothetical protein
VCARSAEVPVEHDDAASDGDDVHDEGEEQVLGDKRDAGRGGRRQAVDEGQKEHKSQQDAHAHRYLFRQEICRQVKYLLELAVSTALQQYKFYHKLAVSAASQQYKFSLVAVKCMAANASL